MRICFIVGSFPSLSETFILNQMTGLLDQRHSVCIYAGDRSDDAVVHEDVIRSGLLNHVRFHNDKPRSRLARVGKFLALLPVALSRAPLTVLHSLNVFRFGREAWSLNLFFKALKFLEARDCEVVFCHFGQNGLTGLRMKELGALKGKLVVVFHAADISAYVEREGRDIYRKLFARGDLFLPVTQHARGKLLELGCPPEKALVHRMGVDLDRFRLNTRKRFGSAPLKILSVARLVEKKGIRYGIEAVGQLNREGFECEYTVVGDGPLRAELEAQARALGVGRGVRFVGWQDSGSVRRYLQDADIFLAPSIRAGNGDEEGIPVVLMEAMAGCIPVVSTPTGGIRELVREGETGFLVEERNAGAIAGKLKQIWSAPALVEKVAVGARGIIEAQYNISVLNQTLIKLFTAVVYEKRIS
ncbi:MAG: colanic acid biosynthesis glycosyltransferase WcaL [Candidatus Omnitrophica bacterium]|nr:colanic acid biosynthesis glycosyltransferase WcaL [Candidatus Omnitrophota bacterium]